MSMIYIRLPLSIDSSMLSQAVPQPSEGYIYFCSGVVAEGFDGQKFREFIMDIKKGKIANLVITRRKGEAIVITVSGACKFKIIATKITKDQCKLCFVVPEEVHVRRRELPEFNIPVVAAEMREEIEKRNAVNGGAA